MLFLLVLFWRIKAPKLFKVIKRARRSQHYVDDYITTVHEHPFRLHTPLNPNYFLFGFFDFFNNAI